ncbi:hypothetical protein SteCoe_36305 [Stentor coeruleus]|uniref:Mic1 domain-containing protein n=1 Tax=Stentor coeruleus TaxID=5963 RepID=A0A1R2AQF9_9CILI|nr:hypothetical protein SteCoe_36305 [Stentor coeruleus]
MNIQTKESLVIKGGKTRIVLGFALLGGKSQFCDMFMVTCFGVDFYKITEKPLKVSNVRGYQFPISDFWFDSDEGILIAHSPNSLEITPFFIYQTRGAKYFQGPSFNLNQKYLDNGFFPSLHSNNLSEIPIQPLDKPQLLLAKIYNSNYLLNLDGIRGILNLYKIEQDAPSSVLLTIKLKPGGVSLRVIDNLIIIHNYGPQESYVYDIKKHIDAEKCMILVKHRGLLNSDNESFQVRYNSEIDPHFLVINKDYYVDPIENRVLVLRIDVESLIKEYPNPIDSVLFLLRRDKCLSLAYKLLCQCLESKIQITILTWFFNVTNSVYKETAMLRKSQKRTEITQGMLKNEPQSPRKSERSENQLKSSWGMTILLQSDVFLHVFKPFYKSKIDFLYLSQVLLAYIYSLITQDLHVHISHHYLLLKTLIKLKNFPLIHSLIEYRMIGNNTEIGLMLCSLENGIEKYPELFNIGIDMLYALKDYTNIVKVLIQKGDLFDAILLIKTYNFEYDEMALKDKAQELGYEEVLNDTLSEIESKNKDL